MAFSSRTARAGWTVYMVRCANGALYTGITNDLVERLRAHNSGKGARYTASFRPVRLAWRTASADRSEASKLEARIKKLPKAEKEKLASRRCRRLPAGLRACAPRRTAGSRRPFRPF